MADAIDATSQDARAVVPESISGLDAESRLALKKDSSDADAEAADANVPDFDEVTGDKSAFFGKVLSDGMKSQISKQIDDLKAKKLEAKKVRAELSKEMRNAKRRRARVLKRAQSLSDEEVRLMCELRAEQVHSKLAKSKAAAKKVSSSSKSRAS